MKTPIQKAMERQTEIFLMNIQALVELYPRHAKDEGEGDFGSQLFLLVTSLDKWFINPEGERSGVVEMLRRAHRRIPPADMSTYFQDISKRIRDFAHNCNEWDSPPEGCEWSQLELAAGQFRYGMYHVGQLHAWLRAHGEEPPEIVGLIRFGKHPATP